MRVWVAGLIGVAVLVVVAGVGVIALVVSSGSETAIVDLDVGDCFHLPDDDGGDQIQTVDVVDCAEPHLAEVVSDGALNSGDDPYPPDDKLFARVEQACRAADVVDSDAFGLLPIAPTPEVWESFDGRFLCVAIPFGGEPMTGSIVAG